MLLGHPHSDDAFYINKVQRIGFWAETTFWKTKSPFIQRIWKRHRTYSCFCKLWNSSASMSLIGIQLSLLRIHRRFTENPTTEFTILNPIVGQTSNKLDEGYLTLYMSVWSYLSKSLQHEISSFKKDIDFNGSRLITRLIKALHLEISVMSTWSMSYITNFEKTIVQEKWDLLKLLPDLAVHVRILIT